MASRSAGRSSLTSVAALVLLVSLALRFFLGRGQLLDVHLSSGGVVTGRSRSGVETFNGIPYALPPTGNRRLRPPQRLPDNHVEKVDATGVAPKCAQSPTTPIDQYLINKFGTQLARLPFFHKLLGQEDCLTVTIQRPANTPADAKLPVLFWIHGGGFAMGSTSTYDASSLVKSGVNTSQPFVFVSVGYRLNGFGFMPGAEVLKDGSANLGLLDQRMALEWVADHVSDFGGDPDKVTIWGESAGAFSVVYQMSLFGGKVTYKSKPLFRGAIANSGTGTPVDRINKPRPQAIYNKVVEQAGCAGSTDTLACLRSLSFATYYAAVTKGFPGILSSFGTKLSFLPRPDGKVLVDSVEKVIASGRYYPVPTIAGCQEDEGTLFALFQRNLKSDEDLVRYFSEVYFANTPTDKIATWVKSYSKNNSTSPFRTSGYQHYSKFGHVAAMIGDQTFTLARRRFLQDATAANPEVPVWSYLSSYASWVPLLGTFHASDLLPLFRGIPANHVTRSARKYYLNFLYNLDPNGDDEFEHWPKWSENRTLLWFETSSKNSHLTDDFRSEQFDALVTLGEAARQ